MYKAVLGLMLLISALPAKDILPLFRLHSVGFVSDFVVDQDRLYAANDRGTVDIFDMNGRSITTIDGGGVWNGTDNAGNAVPAGLYLARANFKGKSKTAVLVFAK